MIKLKRASLALVGASACALTIALAVPASADPYYGDCQQGSNKNCSTPKLHLCPSDATQRDPLCVYVGPGRLSDGSNDDDLHAIVRLDPILCGHAIVDTNGRQSRDLVRTAGCGRHNGQVTPPAAGIPCSCPTPAPVMTPPTPVTEAPVEAAPVAAPAPTIVNNSTATSPLPAVTH